MIFLILPAFQISISSDSVSEGLRKKHLAAYFNVFTGLVHYWPYYAIDDCSFGKPSYSNFLEDFSPNRLEGFQTRAFIHPRQIKMARIRKDAITLPLPQSAILRVHIHRAPSLSKLFDNKNSVLRSLFF